MTLAEIHGKIADSGTNTSERMEDLLTSNVFGCLRYIPANKALIPFLETAISFHGKSLTIQNDVIEVHSAFWPWLTPPGCIPCEPDIVFGFETAGNTVHVVMIEAKYYSELSSEEDERPDPNSQLARELDNLNTITPLMLKWDSSIKIASRTLIYITQDMGIPRKDIAKSLDEYKRKRGNMGDIFWTSWRLLPPILDKIIADEKDSGRKAAIDDLLLLLLRKGLIMFQGIEPCLFQLTSKDFKFYKQATHRYIWPEIPRSADILPDYEYRVVNDE